MFSRTEREFLEILARNADDSNARVLETRFPNPVYRRKLLWGIRQKARAAAADWALYSRAAENEARVLRPEPSSGAGSVPVVTEPFAALVKLFTDLSRGSHHQGKGPGDRP